jgi:hypothetical protein
MMMVIWHDDNIDNYKIDHYNIDDNHDIPYDEDDY